MTTITINPATARDRASDTAQAMIDAATALAPAFVEAFWEGRGYEPGTNIPCNGPRDAAAHTIMRAALEIDNLRLEGAMHYLATRDLAVAMEIDRREAERHDAAVDAIVASGAAPCGCEHARHWADSAAEHGFVHNGHRFMEVAAGKRSARYIGAVCDDCAERCVADYLLER